MLPGKTINTYLVIPLGVLFLLSCSRNSNRSEEASNSHLLPLKRTARTGSNSGRLTVFGVVTDPSGKPIGGAHVKLSFSERPNYFYSARTDVVGKFIYRKLSDSFLSISEVLSICAFSDTRGETCKEVKHSRSKTIRVDLRLNVSPPPDSRPTGACALEGFSFQTAEGGCRHRRTGVVFGRLQPPAFWEEAFSYCENLVEEGYDDWRLPIISQLVETSLPAQGGSSSFSFPLETLKLLTREAAGSGSGDHSVVIMRSGLITKTNRYSHSFVCVRNGTPWVDLPDEISSPLQGECKVEDHRYQSGEGGCKFLPTGFVFSAITSPLFFAEAQSYCSHLNEGGHTDWNLPSVETLKLASFPFQEKLDHLSFSTNREAWTSETLSTSSDQRAVLRLYSGAVIGDNAYSKPTVCVRQGTPESVLPPRRLIPLGACARRGEGFATRDGGCLHSRSRTVYGSSNNPMFIADAEAFCANLVEGGFDDWILPSETDMLNITRSSQGRSNHLKISLNVFYLMSESSSSELQVIHLDSGRTELRSGSWAYRFLCVRKKN